MWRAHSRRFLQALRCSSGPDRWRWTVTFERGQPARFDLQRDGTHRLRVQRVAAADPTAEFGTAVATAHLHLAAGLAVGPPEQRCGRQHGPQGARCGGNGVRGQRNQQAESQAQQITQGSRQSRPPARPGQQHWEDQDERQRSDPRSGQSQNGSGSADQAGTHRRAAAAQVHPSDPPGLVAMARAQGMVGESHGPAMPPFDRPARGARPDHGLPGCFRCSAMSRSSAPAAPVGM